MVMIAAIAGTGSGKVRHRGAAARVAVMPVTARPNGAARTHQDSGGIGDQLKAPSKFSSRQNPLMNPSGWTIRPCSSIAHRPSAVSTPVAPPTIWRGNHTWR